MKLAIVSDHRGYDLKQDIIAFLKQNNYDIKDLGCYSKESCDYVEYAFKLGDEIKNHNADIGIAVCGTGIGMSIACNKMKDILCAKVTNFDEAQLARLHNDANIIALSATTPKKEAFQYVKTFIDTPFSKEERHIRRVKMIKEYEDKHEC